MHENRQGEAMVFVDRRNTNCSKWDGLKELFGSDALQAMWVADMDFQALCGAGRFRLLRSAGILF